ncbi:MAG TPA: hypothetical protein VK966_04345 [Longimicrobiales bacterium]|nr:hypothetical protein [Longimicrobiales bacterium]
MRALLLPVIVFCLLLSGCGRANSSEGAGKSNLNSLLVRLSHKHVSRIGDAIGRASEARFLDGGKYVIVLDDFEPHLRLFSAAGDSLWEGGPGGGGPAELQTPQTLIAGGHQVLVAQHGRLSEWQLQEDSLAFVRSWPVPASYFPLGMEYGCDGELLFYARNDAQFTAASDGMGGRPVQFLHRATLDGDSVTLRPLWSTERDPAAVAALGHNGTLISHIDSRIVVWHRTSPLSSGSIIEFECNATPRYFLSERALVTGDSAIPTHAPRESSLDWTAGIAALPDGFVVPIQRYFSSRVHNVDRSHWRTEIFRFVDGRFQTSVLVERQWTIMDYHPRSGLLMAAEEPVPHFITLPASLVATLSDQ